MTRKQLKLRHELKISCSQATNCLPVEPEPIIDGLAAWYLVIIHIKKNLQQLTLVVNNHA